MSDGLTLGHQVTLQFMPVLMLVGAIMSIGASFWGPPRLLIFMCSALFLYWFYTMRNLRFERTDVRFFLLPILVLATGLLTYYHLLPAFYDQAYHLQISNRILDRWDWEPTHQGMSYSFRPEIISGIAAIELWLTGEVSVVVVTPTLLLISTAWSIQHVGEYFSNRTLGFISGAVFCLLPVTIMFGRTMLLDVAVAGMLVTSFHHIHLTTDKNREKHLLLGILTGIIGLTKYAYLYLGGWIALLYWLRKKTEESKYIACGYGMVIALFLLKNLIHTGHILGPLQSQITGTLASTSAIATDTVVYTPHVFMEGFIGQWGPILICIAIYGSALIAKKDREYILNYWLFILPAVVLHGYVLNFGWPRYSTPWLALLCVGIPAALAHSTDEFKGWIRRWKIPSFFIGVLVMTSIGPLLQNIEDIKPRSESLHEARSHWATIYRDVGTALTEPATIVTGRDITMGLHSQLPCFRYEDQHYSMLQAINKFEPTHVFTQDIYYRYDIDVNSTFLYGSPIEPVGIFSSNQYVGRLWEVNQPRLEQSDYWRNTSIEVNGNGLHYGDFVWLEAGSDFELLENTAIRQIYETNSEINLDDIFIALAQNRDRLLCDSVDGCSEFNRTEHIQRNWAVWMVKTNGV